MRFFIINLERDKDRLEYMQAELQQLGFVAERFPAVFGLDMPEALKPFFLNDDGTIISAMNKGEVGCYASHLAVMERIIKENIDEPVCVMEDDLRFEPGFPHLPQLMDELPQDWEILRLSNPTKADCQLEKTLGDGSKLVSYWRVPNNTGAYIINKAGAQKFLSCRKERMRPVDEDLRRPWEHGLKTYGILPSPVTSNIFDSSISAIGGSRERPGRKRFSNARSSLWQEWRYRLKQFGVFGCLRSIFNTLLFKKALRSKWNQ